MNMDHLVRVELSDAKHKLPMPGTQRLFTRVETVDMRDLFWMACLNDGSIKKAAPEKAEAPELPKSPAASE
jgi:hypothetical protein